MPFCLDRVRDCLALTLAGFFSFSAGVGAKTFPHAFAEKYPVAAIRIEHLVEGARLTTCLCGLPCSEQSGTGQRALRATSDTLKALDSYLSQNLRPSVRHDEPSVTCGRSCCLCIHQQGHRVYKCANSTGESLDWCENELLEAQKMIAGNQSQRHRNFRSVS